MNSTLVSSIELLKFITCLNCCALLNFVVYAYYFNSDYRKTTSLKSIQHCRHQRNRKVFGLFKGVESQKFVVEWDPQIVDFCSQNGETNTRKRGDVIKR